MPLTTDSVGLVTEPFEHDVDARWTMAYSAGLGDVEPCYLDTSRPGGVLAHPLFTICPEWPVALASRDQLREHGLTMDEFRRAVHASHDCHVLRPIRPGDRLRTRATITGLEAWPSGAFVTTCFESTDGDGEVVARTFHGQLLRDVEILASDDAVRTAGPATPRAPHLDGLTLAADAATESLALAANFAHVYTECARIWNPIHTDEAVAQAAGLPHFILHGSATLARAVSAMLRRHAPGEPARARRIYAQFRAMVLLPATLTLRCGEPVPGGAGLRVPFEVTDPDGAAVLRHGCLELDA